MGLTVTAASYCTFETDAISSELHWHDDLIFVEGDSFPARLDGYQPGFYRCNPSDRWSFQVGSYSYFHWWRNELSQLALGVSTKTIYAAPENFTGRPFFELLVFGDDSGAIGPTTSDKLHADFLAHRAKAEATREGDFFDTYKNWMLAFHLAKQQGFVTLS